MGDPKFSRKKYDTPSHPWQAARIKEENEILKKYANYLKLKEASDEWYEFFDLAAAESGRLPKELREKEIVARMPFLFRTIRGKKITKEKLDKLIKLIKES